MEDHARPHVFGRTGKVRWLRAVFMAFSACFLVTACGQQPSAQQQTEPEKIAESNPSPPTFVPPEIQTDEQDYAPPPLFDPSPIFNPTPLDHPLPMFQPPPIESESGKAVMKSDKGGKPLKLEKTKIKGIPLYKMVISLDDPQTCIAIGLANNAEVANCSHCTAGAESFDSFVKKYPAALIANGTFFSKDEQQRVMGNMVSAGKFLKYSQWETYGTTLGIKENNELEMVTARAEGQPKWDDYWFSITCGPRVVRNGEVDVNAEQEGFQDSHVLTIGPRCAIGFNRKNRELIYASFLRGLSLEKEGELMKALGCDEAMNLDGGASRALAANGAVVMKAGRPLTNVLIVYDAKHPAPKELVASWNRFQEGERPDSSIVVAKLQRSHERASN